MTSRHVLIVEDSAPVRAVLRRMLERAFTLELVDDAPAAMAFVDARVADGLPIHFFLSDFELPTNDGLMVLRHCREKLPAVPRFLMSSAHPPDVARHVADGLVHRFLLKPIHREDLLSL